MMQQDDGEDSTEAIRRQFADLQAEMRRVMAEPARGVASPPPAAEAVDFESIERGLEDLRRDANRLRAHMAEPAEAPIMADEIGALRARIEEIGKQAEDAAASVKRAAQVSREAVAALSLRVDAMARRRPSRWPVPLAILLGAGLIAGAVLASTPGSLQTLIERIDALIHPPKPHAEAAAPPAPAEPVPAPPQAVATLPPPAPPPVVETPPAPPAPTPEPVVAVAPPPPIPAAPPPADPPAPAGQIVLHAKADAWVEVRNRQGGTLIGRVLRAGESWPVPDQPSLVLSTGNAGGLELLVDGAPAPALGASGTVRRDVPLDAALVRAGRYAADPAKPTASR